MALFQPTRQRICWIILLVFLLLFTPRGAVGAQAEVPWEVEAEALLQTMSVEERVGQLFLVTFTGSDVVPESDIVDLIANYHVAGVVLLSENDNFSNEDDITLQATTLTNKLQEIALEGPPPLGTSVDDSEIPVLPADAPPPAANQSAIPLLIATVYDGDGAPSSEILSGLTNVPNQMAIGATWNSDHSYAIGKIVGQELSSIGINMLLGPSLDVLENPLPFNRSDLGIRTFGGDPYWVGLMGQSYTAGVHDGSNNRMAVIGKHFPGFGSSDRPLNEEVGTVRKSLEQLKQIELAPFFAITGNATDPATTADGLLTAHIRYQGFQGNIRVTTAPVSFDPQALTALMQLPEFSTWRQNGGVIVSDSLGAPAVQRFYEDTGQEFPHRLVAKDALLAGNDLLYLSNFAIGEDADYSVQLTNIKDTINWFKEKYETDQTFKQRTDEAVLRVLQLKLRLYDGNFNEDNVLTNPDAIITDSPEAEGAVFNLAQDAITLISPSSTELTQVLPPNTSDRIVVFTDVRESRQCSTCPLEALLDRESLQNRMLALYGPQASDQVRPEQLRSYSFEELELYLQNAPIPAPTPTAEPGVATATPESEVSAGEPAPTPVPTPTISPAFFVQESLVDADLIIFAMLNPDESVAGSQALNEFLARRPEIARDARIIVFAYNAPYYLDTTEISRLTAYFGVYSQIDRFVDASVRALFQEATLQGRPPVNVPGISYDLFEVTKPDPSQVIELYIVDQGEPQSPPSQAPLEVVPGATLRLQTGVIRDHNGNTVPDGTLVQFVQQDRIQGFVNVIDERPTVDGIANLDYLLEARTGNFRITAVSGEAISSQEINIVIGESAIVSVNTPIPTATILATITSTPSPTETPAPTFTLTPTATPRPSPTAVPDNEAEEPPVEPIPRELQMILGITAGLLVTGGTGYFIGRNGSRRLDKTVRWVLWAFAGGLLAYNYFALDLPGAGLITEWNGWAGFVITVIGGAIGLAAYQWVKRSYR
ncbi:MAG: glycoside hydrolase family 3 N-terminal domain-containing protein [Candidatus Promineifilaceae bacterium]